MSAASLEGRRFREVRGQGAPRVLEVLWVWPNAAGDLAMCRLVEGRGRARTRVSVARLLSPVVFEEVEKTE